MHLRRNDLLRISTRRSRHLYRLRLIAFMFRRAKRTTSSYERVRYRYSYPEQQARHDARKRAQAARRANR